MVEVNSSDTVERITAGELAFNDLTGESAVVYKSSGVNEFEF